MTKIKTNERFDNLTNFDISTHYKDEEFYFMRSDFLSAFAYWIITQSPYDTPNITSALEAFGKYVARRVKRKMPEKFTYTELNNFICEDVFETIPEIEELNHPKVSSGAEYENRYNIPHPDFDFIDLGALARNVFFMLLREKITQS